MKEFSTISNRCCNQMLQSWAHTLCRISVSFFWIKKIYFLPPSVGYLESSEQDSCYFTVQTMPWYRPKSSPINKTKTLLIAQLQIVPVIKDFFNRKFNLQRQLLERRKIKEEEKKCNMLQFGQTRVQFFIFYFSLISLIVGQSGNCICRLTNQPCCLKSFQM